MVCGSWAKTYGDAHRHCLWDEKSHRRAPCDVWVVQTSEYQAKCSCIDAFPHNLAKRTARIPWTGAQIMSENPAKALEMYGSNK